MAQILEDISVIQSVSHKDFFDEFLDTAEDGLEEEKRQYDEEDFKDGNFNTYNVGDKSFSLTVNEEVNSDEDG